MTPISSLRASPSCAENALQGPVLLLTRCSCREAANLSSFLYMQSDQATAPSRSLQINTSTHTYYLYLEELGPSSLFHFTKKNEEKKKGEKGERHSPRNARKRLIWTISCFKLAFFDTITKMPCKFMVKTNTYFFTQQTIMTTAC